MFLHVCMCIALAPPPPAGVCGLLGMPWVCGAPIRSVQHLQALSVYSTKNPPGEKPKLLFIREQRVTTFVVHFLISEYVCMCIIYVQIYIITYIIYLCMYVCRYKYIHMYNMYIILFILVYLFISLCFSKWRLAS